MSVVVPNQTVAITRNDLPTPDFRRWQLAITDAVNAPAEVAPVEPVTGDYLPLSTYVRGVDGIAFYGALSTGGVLLGLETLADSGTGALLGITRDDFGRVSGTTDATITGTAGQITVANGDAVAGPPTLSLADVTNAGGGTLQKTAFDAKGRKTGSSAATTSDLAEGSNLYYTATRVRAALLLGLSTASSAVITAADSVLSAFGKLQAQITALTASLSGYVQTSRTISTTAPLTGGGDLSANRTLAISAATTVAAGSMSAADKAKLDAIADSGWVAPTLQNSWVDFGSTFAASGYRKIGSQVFLRGMIKSGDTTEGITLFTLGAGYRPPSTLVFAIYHAGGACRLDVDNAGLVRLRSATSNVYVSLSGVSFFVD